jgi:multidrug efflux system outer membrane protein
MKKTTKVIVRLIVLPAAIILGGCSLHQVEPPVMKADVPSQFSESGSAEATEQWWQDFPDKGLADTIDHVLKNNLEMLQAWARLEQSHELAVQAGAALWPQVELDADATRSRSNAATSGNRKDTEPVRSSRYFMGVGLSYELDLWGRIRSLRDAAATDVEASRQDLNTTAIRLAAQTAETWFAVIEQKATLELLTEQLEINRTYLRLNQARFALGLGTALDVYQQQQLTAGTRTRIPKVKMQIAILENALAVLMGEFPSRRIPEPGASFPGMPAFPDTGIPADLLERRPDVMVARLRVTAADYRVAQAMAERLPALRIGGSGGFRAVEPAWLLENLVWDIFAGLSATLLDGGRKASEVKRQEAIVKERLAGYVKSGIQAVTEVEDAISRERFQREYLERLDEQIQAAKSTLRQANLRYAAGLTDYLPVLAALQSVQGLQIGRISSQQELYGYRIQLYKSLGGSWIATDTGYGDSSLQAQPETSGGRE